MKMCRFADAGKTNPKQTQLVAAKPLAKPDQTQPVVSLPAVPVLSLPKGARSNRRTYFEGKKMLLRLGLGVSKGDAYDITYADGEVMARRMRQKT